MMIGALLVFGASLLTSAYFFNGFLGDGRSWVGVFQAFLLCFGLGSLLFLPALALFFMARHVRMYGVKLKIGIAALLISLPLWLGGGSALALRLPQTLLALTLLTLGLGVFAWGFMVLRAARTRK
ncbi:MAG: hypothetical protein COA69_06590 [Robiginitomaculum sp.]|nr:MAG: hypothetical protein COA69_06590 [Robiginitomaculum sp.]